MYSCKISISMNSQKCIFSPLIMLSIIVIIKCKLCINCLYTYQKIKMTDHLQKMRKQLLIFKIMMVGQSGVGKSSIVIRYIQHTFSQSTTMTLGIDFLQKKISYQNRTIKLQLWDTSGQQKFKATGVSRLKRSNAIFCVYQMGDQKSVDDIVQYWIPKAYQECTKGTVFLVFGNKSDLVEDRIQIKKRVDDKLQKLSQKYQIEILSFMGNCKQQQNRGINQAIQTITHKLFQERRKRQIKQQQQMILNKKRAELEKPAYRESIKIHQNYQKKQSESKKKKKCLFF